MAAILTAQAVTDVGAQPLAGDLAIASTLDDVELFNGGVCLTGRLDRGHFRRLSDFVNHSHGWILLRDAVVVDRADPGRQTPRHDAWIDPIDIDLIGQRAGSLGPTSVDMTIEKSPHQVIALTSSHQVCGTVHVHRESDLGAFLRADETPLIVITDALVTWLADGRLAGSFALLLMNRRRTFAVMSA